MGSHAFSDEELTAYLDGEADPQLVSTIDAAKDEPEVASRLTELRLPMDQIAAAGELSLRQAPAMPVFEEPSVQRGQYGRMGLIAATAFGVIVGTSFMFLAQPDQQRDWVDQVAAYQALYVEETLTLAPQPRGVADRVIADFAASTGLDMAEATDLDGATFARAQMLGIEGAPLLQMVFALPDGTPMALCVMYAGDGAAKPMSDTSEGLALTQWAENGFGFVVIGGGDTETTMRLADQAQSLISL